MSDRAKELYVRAFGETRYEDYRSAVNNSALYKKVEPGLKMRHTGFHDVESFVWVLYHELLLAWPKDSTDDEFGDSVRSTINGLEDHVFGQEDKRPDLLSFDSLYWEQRLHSEFSFLAEPIKQISLYMKNEWAVWPELPEDHAHEALAIMLLEMACMIEERGDIELREEERGQSTRTKDKAATRYVFQSRYDVTTPRKRTAAGTGEVPQPRAPKKSKTTHATQDNAQAGPSRPVKTSKPTRQVSPTPAKAPRKQGKKVLSVEDVHVQKDVVYVGPTTRSRTRTRTRTSSRNRKQTPPRF